MPTRGHALVFAADWSCRLDSQLADILRSIQRTAGFPENGKTHTLRHTFCSRLAMKAVPVKVIQTLAGHANIETTERYLHSDRNLENEAMKLLSTSSAKVAA